MPEIVPVSVVVPTIGRPRQLQACLGSLAQCSPRAAEILIVDQSVTDEIEHVAQGFQSVGARTVRSSPRGVAVARNQGLRAAIHETVLMTDDDCTVSPDWIGTGWRLLEGDPRLIVSGRVLGVGDEQTVPSTISDTVRRDYTGTIHCGVLFTNNVALNREAVLAIGAFDDAFETAEDNDLCYRWLTSGGRLVYEPALLVWHHHWRSPAELKRLYVSYWRGQGALYAKHLRAGDRRMLRLAARDVYWRLRAPLGGAGGLRVAAIEARGIVLGLPVGVASYLWTRRRVARGHHPTEA